MAGVTGIGALPRKDLRPFRLKLTERRLGGRHRVRLAVSLRGGKRLTLKASVHGLC